MFKNIDRFKKLSNQLVLYCIFIIDIVLTLICLHDLWYNYRTFEQAVILVILLWGFYILDFILVRNDGLSKYAPLSIVFGFILYYAYSLFSDNLVNTWTHAIPFVCLMPLFYDKSFYQVATDLSILTINILSAYQFDSLVSMNTLNRLCILILVFVFTGVVTFLLKQYDSFIQALYNDTSVDQITGLYNDSYINDKIVPMLNQNKNLTYTMIMVNIDRFHKFNEECSHTFGDTVLSSVADIIMEELGAIKADVNICRLYGDKFIIVVTNRNYEELKEHYTSLKKHLNSTILNYRGTEFIISTTICVTDTRFCEHTYNGLYRRVRYLQDLSRQQGYNLLIEDFVKMES